MRTKWKDSLTYKSLKTIGEIIDGVYDLLPKQKSLYEVLYTEDKIRLYQSVSRLKAKGFIKEKKINGEKIFSITNEGRKKLEDKKDLFADKTWDGNWRFVIFDIPADKKEKRDFFRRSLKEMGFKLYQKSVWISPYDLEEEVNKVRNLVVFRPYVKYILARKISDETEWKRKFKLK